MNDLKHITYLIERFLDGLTTLDEEREIESFIRANRRNLSSMPEDLQIVAEMFRELQSMDRPSKIKRLTLLWRWDAAAVVAVAVAFGVFLHSRTVALQDSGWPSEAVLIVKASRNVEAIEADSGGRTVTETQPIIRPASKNRGSMPAKKQLGVPVDDLSGPMQPDAIILDVPARMPMAATEFVPVVSDRKELNELMLECEMKILEDKYQAYASERRTIKI